VKGVHSRSAGLGRRDFPRARASTVAADPGRGVFSSRWANSRWEQILSFAKDFRRLVRNQLAGRWGTIRQSDDISRPDGGHRRLWRYGRAVATRAVRAMGSGSGCLSATGPPLYNRGDPLVSHIFRQRGPPTKMVARSDYVVRDDAAGPKETRGLIGASGVRSMKPTRGW